MDCFRTRLFSCYWGNITYRPYIETITSWFILTIKPWNGFNQSNYLLDVWLAGHYFYKDSHSQYITDWKTEQSGWFIIKTSYLPGEEVVLIEPEDDKSIFMAHPQEWVKATFEYNTSQPPIATINKILPVNAAKDDNASLTDHTPLVAANDDLQLTQRTSTGFGPMIRYLETGDLPTEGRKARSILAQAQHFVMIDGTLFHLYYHALKIFLRQIDWYDNWLYPKIIDYR